MFMKAYVLAVYIEKAQAITLCNDKVDTKTPEYIKSNNNTWEKAVIALAHKCVALNI